MSDLEKMAEVHGDRCAELPVCPTCRAEDLRAKAEVARAAQREEDALAIERLALNRSNDAVRRALLFAAEEIRRAGLTTSLGKTG